jgi:hypothetical protein
VGAAPLQLIVDVPALKVRPVGLAIFTGVAPDNVIVEEPNEIDLVVVPLVPNESAVTVKFPVLKDPATIDSGFTFVKLLPNVQPPPTPVKFRPSGPKVTLLVVMVLPVVVAKKLRLEPLVDVNTTPVAAFVQLP